MNEEDENIPNKRFQLSTFAGFAGNVNNMLGSGIYSTPGIVWQAVGSPGIGLLLWFLGGLINLCGSLTYVELGTMTLENGGEASFLKRAFPTPRLLMSYLFSFAWICAIRPASLGAVLQSFAQYLLFAIIPHPALDNCQESIEFHQKLNSGDWRSEKFWILKIIGIVALAIITGYHMLSNEWANKVNQLLAIVKMATLTVVIVIGFVRLGGSDIKKNWPNAFEFEHKLSFPNIASALTSIFFAYNGWNNLNYSLDEFKNPKKNLALSNIASVIVVTILYTLTNVAFITVVDSDIVNKPGKDFNEVIAGDFAKKVGGEGFARTLSFFVALSAFGAASSMTWSGSRVIVEASKNNFIPIFSKSLRKLHEKKFTPQNALLAQFILFVVIFLSLGGAISSDSFKTLSDFSIYFAWIFYFLAGVGLLWLRYKKPRIDRPFKVWIPVTIIFICVAIFIFVGSSIDLDVQPTQPLTSSDCQDPASPIASYIKSIICIGFLIVGSGCWYISVLSNIIKDPDV